MAAATGNRTELLSQLGLRHLDRILNRCAVRGLRILEDFPLEIAEDNAIDISLEDVLGIDGNLSAAAGGVDHELGHSIAAGVAAQAANNLNAFADARAEMGGA